MTDESPTLPWGPSDGARLYRIADWGRGYFDISAEGTVRVHPRRNGGHAIDLFELVEGLREREIAPPLLIRFSDITRDRMEELKHSFEHAIAEIGYRGTYSCVYPIKVNQARHVCEEVRDIAASLGFGLEVGSKAELVAALSLTDGHDDMPIVCNGFKDEEYLDLVTWAAKLGRRILPVIEQLAELPLLLRVSRQQQAHVEMGLRLKLTAQGTGRWADSVGHRGKFGLTPGQMLEALDMLNEADQIDRLTLLHCHIGSQVSDIHRLKDAVSELTHAYAQLVHLGAPLRLLDIGGGLGVDYDGTHSPTDSSVNYDVAEYAMDVVYRVAGVCDREGIPHPDLITESGRAIAAYSSVLVCEEVGRRVYDAEFDVPSILEALGQREELAAPLRRLMDAAASAESTDPIELYHDTTHARDEAISLFRLGLLSINDQAMAERISGFLARSILERAGWPSPSELEELAESMSDIVFLNLSLFQSLPDMWAIDQVFPIMPIHRLECPPTRRAILADMTCDSDGKIVRFAGPEGGKSYLEVHEPVSADGSDGASYYLGVFLVGAYQETLGDLHNLLGDTHAVHVELDQAGSWSVETVVEGDRVRDVLSYVRFDADDMRATIRRSVERAIRAGLISVAEGNAFRAFYAAALNGYTYPE